MNVIRRNISAPVELCVPEQFNLKVFGASSRKRISLLMHNIEDLLKIEVGQKARCFLDGEKKFSVVHTEEGNLFVSLKKTLGEGASKKVKIGLRLNGLALVALGKMKPDFSESEYRKEISTLQLLQDNQSVVKLLDSYKAKSSSKDQRANIQEKQIMVTEFCDENTLHNYGNKNQRLSAQNQKFLFGRFEEIIEALVQIHAKGIVHSDIKSENIFLHQEHAKIGDFGSAKKEGMRDLGGTPCLMPIELVFAFSKKYFGTSSEELATMNVEDPNLMKYYLLESDNLLANGKQDVWSFGMTLFEAFFGSFYTTHLSKEKEFASLRLQSLYKKSPVDALRCIKDAYLKMAPEKIPQILKKLPIRTTIEKKVVRILSEILVLDPGLRPNSREARDLFVKIKNS